MTLKGQKIYRRPIKIREFLDWMPEKLKEHLNEGWSINSFAPRYNISSQHWHIIARTSPELIPIRDEYMESRRYKKQSFG